MAKLLLSLVALFAGMATWEYLTKPGVGAPCVQNANCRSNLCFETRDFPVEGYCSQWCARDADCPAGFTCRAATAETRYRLGGRVQNEASVCQK